MPTNLTLRVLLVGETVNGCPLLREWLERKGCQCTFASSSQEIQSLLKEQEFDLVLTTARQHAAGARQLSELVTGSHASLFCSYLVEDDCFWLPVMRAGRKCFGAPALRPSEFASALNEILQEIRCQIPLAPRRGAPRAA
jgi:hypothetical protein